MPKLSTDPRRNALLRKLPRSWRGSDLYKLSPTALAHSFEDDAPPAEGDRVETLGCPGTVIGYWSQHGYLGVLVHLDHGPEWWTDDQRRDLASPTGTGYVVGVFGAELRPLPDPA